MIGEVLNQRYTIIDEIGRGGMGVVYRAYDEMLGRDVAVKAVTTLDIGAEGRERLLSEANAIARLSHPNIVALYDAREENDVPYIVMEYVEGQTLHDAPPADYEGIVSVAAQICAALDHTHSRRFIHRDLKPENVLLEADGTVKLADFGLAHSVASRITSEGEIMGTVFYLAPELALGQDYDGRADLYALGVMLYELTTGELPFVDDNPVAVITQHLNAPVVPPRAKKENLPAHLDSLILRLLEKDPENRPASAAVVLEILESPEKADEHLLKGRELFVLDRIVRGRFVGRSEEYEAARSLWREAATGSGQTLFISGEPGIGKTRLTREIITQVEISGGRAFVGAANVESNTPYGPFSQMVRKALESQSKNGVELPDSMLDDLLDLAPDMRPFFPDVAPNPELDPESKQMRLLENMVAFCNKLGETQPLLLVLDDAHWADSSSIAMFQHLSGRTRQLPLMMLATYRDSELLEGRALNNMLLELDRQRIGTQIALDRLDREKTWEMLEAIFNDEITPDFLEGIYHETDGNPFLVEEVCRALVESGKVYYANGEWHHASMDELEIPAGVQDAVESRLTKLPDYAQDALRMAAVLGREFDHEVLIEASNMTEDDIIASIELADRAQMVREGREDTLYEFAHALVPQSIRANTHRRRLRELHGRAAYAYEAMQPNNYESLAYHYGEGGNNDRAQQYYTLAGERALKNYANEDAENYFGKAIDIAGDEVEQASLMGQLGKAQLRLSRFHDAIQTLQPAIDLLIEQGDEDRAAELFALTARAADLPSDLEICHKAFAALDGTPDGPGMAQLLTTAASVCYFNGATDEVESFANLALEMADRLNLPDVRADTLLTLGNFKGPGSPEKVLMIEEAVEIAESANLLKQAARGNNDLGVLRGEQGNYSEALKQYKRAHEYAIKIGDLDQQVFFSGNQLWMRLLLGQLRDFMVDRGELDLLLKDLPDAGRTGRMIDEIDASFAIERGDFQEALQLTARNIWQLSPTSDVYQYSASLNFRSQLLLITGELNQAEESVDKSLKVARNLESEAYVCCLASVIASRRGDLKKANRTLAKAQEITENKQPVFWTQVHIVRAEAHLLAARGEWDAAWKKFAENHDNLAMKQLRWHRLWFATEWADAHLQLGQDDDVARAKELLEEARLQADDMGAPGWVKLIEEKLMQISLAT